MKNKIIKISIILLIVISFKGCFNYKDINNVTFATSVIFDISDEDKIIAYVDALKPYRSPNEDSDKGRRIIYKGEGMSAIDAIYDISLASSSEVNYSQNRAYIFTQKAAEGGIEKFLSLIENNQEFKVKSDIYIYSGNIDTLLEVTSNDEEYLGLYLEKLADKSDKNPRSINANINDYLNNALMEDNTYIVGVIKIKEDALDKKIEIGGGAVLKNNKLVSILDSRGAMSYNILMNNLHNGIVYTENPEDEKGILSFEILETNIETNLEVIDDNLDLIKEINIKASLAEVQTPFTIDKESVRLIKENKEKDLEEKIEKLFNQYKEKDIDLFGIKRILNVKYPKLDIEDVISKTNLKVKVNLDFEGTGIIKNTY